MSKLLEKALEIERIPPGRKPKDIGFALSDQLELAIGYAEGKVTGQQVAAAVNCSPSNGGNWAEHVIFRAYRAGLLVRASANGSEGK